MTEHCLGSSHCYLQKRKLKPGELCLIN